MQYSKCYIGVHVILGILGHLSIGEARRNGVRQSPDHRETSIREETRAHEWCPQCDINHCPIVTKDTCDGIIALDLCHCCPICKLRNKPDQSSTPVPSGLEQLTYAPQNDLFDQSEACKKIECPKFQVCMLNIQGLPMCRCPTKFWCMKGDRSPVCGQDNITYKSKCFLKAAECESNRNIPMKYKGKCYRSEKDRDIKLDRVQQKEEKRAQRMEKRKKKQERVEKKKRKKEKKQKKDKRRHRRERNHERWSKIRKYRF